MVWSGSALIGLSAPAATIVWCLTLLVLLGLMSVAMLLARKRWCGEGNPQDGEQDSGFTLERLDALHRGGQISDEEFSRLRRQVSEWMRPDVSSPSGSSHPPGRDDGNASRTTHHPERGCKDF
jgi:hypothetical protein